MVVGELVDVVARDRDAGDDTVVASVVTVRGAAPAAAIGCVTGRFALNSDGDRTDANSWVSWSVTVLTGSDVLAAGSSGAGGGLTKVMRPVGVMPAAEPDEAGVLGFPFVTITWALWRGPCVTTIEAAANTSPVSSKATSNRSSLVRASNHLSTATCLCRTAIPTQPNPTGALGACQASLRVRSRSAPASAPATTILRGPSSAGLPVPACTVARVRRIASWRAVAALDYDQLSQSLSPDPVPSREDD